MRPSIFKFAASELSQDAFICYVLAYYNDDLKEKYPLEYEFARFFVHKLLEKIKIEDLEINSLKVEKQHMSIDIFLTINESVYIIIEDKVFTYERENQLNNYRNKVIKRYEASEENVYCIYYKTGDECYSNILSIEEIKNTKTILREEIIQIFEKYKGTNIIFQDYLFNLKDIQNERAAFKYRDLRNSNFTWNEINGFYNELDKAFTSLKSEGILSAEIGFDWGYTDNKNGGFMCYSFQNVVDFDTYGHYLQLECDSKNMKFVFKVWSEDKDISLLYKGFEVLKENYGEAIKKPFRFSRGNWMTQAIVKEYLVIDEIGIIDVYKTALNIAKWLEKLRALRDKL